MIEPPFTNDAPSPLVQLRQQIVTHFSLEELRTLCFDLRVNFDELPGQGLTPKVRDLLQIMWRNGRIETLLTAVTQIRPTASWPDLAALQADSLVDPTTHKTQGVWVGVPPLPPNFLGRDELIASLVGRLISGRLTLSVEGQPGVGKTALAVALAHRFEVRRHFKDGILWAGLGPQADVMSVLAGWALALGQDVTHMTEMRERQQAVQRAIGQQQILLVLDDTWELESATTLRCGGPNCCHLLTTRDKELARAFAGAAQTVSVSTLADSPAFALLQELAPEVCQVDPETAWRLAQAVGGLPLALALLGGYLSAPEHRFFPDLSQAALAEMHDPRQRLELAQERLGTPGQLVTLQETVALSLAGLRETQAGQRAVDAFYALGAFAPKPEQFSREAAEVVTNSDGAALALLIARNLMEMHEGQLALHQVLADVARTKLTDDAVSRHRLYYLNLVNEDRENWRRIATMYGQIKWAWGQASLPHVLDFVWALRIYQERQGLWRDALEWAKRGLTCARATHNKEAEGTLLNNIGLIYYRRGQREQALDYLDRTLSILEEVDDQAGLAATLNNIGGIYHSLNQSEQALDYYNRALPIRENVGDRSGLAVTLNNIGYVYHSLEQWDKALDYYNRTLPILEEVGDQAGLATALGNIGGVYDNLGQPEQALDYYNRTLSISEDMGDRPGLATALGNIGLVYSHLGQPEQALDHYNRALLILEEIGDRAVECVTRYDLAIVYRTQGQLAKAVVELRRVVELDRLMQHPDLQSDMALLAEVEAELAQGRSIN